MANEGGIADFRAETSLPVDLYYHAAAASGGRLFVSGGLTLVDIQGNGATLARVPQVFSASWGSHGMLGAWNEVGELPERLVNHAMAVVGDRLYVLGGEPESHGETEFLGFSAKTWSATIDRKGRRLGPFRTERMLPMGRGWHTVLVDGRRLIVAGGAIGRSFSSGNDQIWIADVQEDGSIGTFHTIVAPADLYYDGGSAITSDRLYVLTDAGAIYSIDLRALDGAEWRRETHVPRWDPEGRGPSGSVRAAALGNALVYLLWGGVATSAPLDAEGRVGEFRASARIVGNAVSGFSATVNAMDRLYVAGGSSGFVPSRRIDAVFSTGRY